jgi:anaerobic magnesium-protoporphyrin IX monomethyl ester cyclase
VRVLLVNPAIEDGSLGTFSKLMEPMPVVGLAYLAAICERDGHDLMVIDQFAQRSRPADIAARAASFGAEVLGIGMLTPAVPTCVAIVRACRAAAPGIRVVAGNIHADVFARELLEDGDADVVAHGEAEDTLSEVLAVLQEGDIGGLASVLGVSWRDDAGEVHRNAARPHRRDLDALPWPAWHRFPVHRYGLLPLADVARPTLAMAASRGCPYRCEFCSLLHAGANYRARDPIGIVDEYQGLHERYGARQIGFMDPVFPLHRGAMLAFCEEVMRRGLHKDVVWVSETRVDRIDRETLRVMRASGCRRLLLGIESGVDMLLENVNKTFDTERVRRAVALCREEGVETIGLFMIGLPGETEEMTRQTIDFAASLPLDFAKFAITVPFPGSQLFEDLRREGRLDTSNWGDWTTFQPDPERLPYVPRSVDNATLLRLQKEGTRRFYLRPGMIWHHLVTVRTVQPRQIWNGLRAVRSGAG